MDYPQLELADFKGPKAIVKTSEGEFEIALFPEQAPKTVENFIGLAKKNYYDGVIFHRVIEDFMIQGGDPTGTGMGGESLWGKPFADEFSNQLFNLKGALSMANAGPNTNGSQFFIVTNSHLDPSMKAQLSEAGFPKPIIDAYQQGGTPWLDHRHTVFGQVLSGMSVVEKISKVKTGANDKPVEPVTINELTIQD
ncbi:peptidylprolyl isomerase [Lacticaseibacillus chiayiensis]|uniref:Peptidyl-prolyl cis-trans isomerase n=1 Tax=Lacticaseibacillus chiayiensis TaxID=2100821 RepID=A0A4Q1TM63_9LACO|nr:peptidylprolyl isomerase [Lacticaseibacillus chiayiensis]QVI35386.1 peptidylprolyl isomerase [Lacticaseibacillus chiayiensis]RXT19115.1 peptidylprolyl isomerase [Lacticaseibacillus chiayiensis]UYN57170.1 peptidylprolyl isomerase [Lacticaseibacillus chiayiensis]